MEKVSLEDLLNIVRAKTSTEVSMSSYLTNDLGLDSLDMAELVIQLGDALGFEIPDEEAEKFHTVQDVWDYVQAHQGDINDKGE
jgi:acyl carrier protein